MRENSDTTRKARYGVTRKKHITLTKEGHASIAAWAEAQGLTFSAAIETLALGSIEEGSSTASAILTANLLERIVGRQFNRFAKLLSLTAIAAESVNWKADAMLLQLIRHEAEADPRNFVNNMAVSAAPDDKIAVQVRQMREEMKQAAHQTAVRRLKNPLQEADLLLHSDDANGTDADSAAHGGRE